MAKRRREAGLRLGLASAALADFDRGAHVFGVNKGQFSMIDIAAAVLEKTGPADVSVWTWVVAAYEVEALGAFYDSDKIRSFRMVIDWAGTSLAGKHVAAGVRGRSYIADLQERFGVDCIRVTKSHAKIVTVSTDCGWRVVIRGSMNLNENRRLEQFDVSDDPSVFDVVSGLEAEMWERGKSLPVEQQVRSEATELMRTVGEGDAPSWGPDAAGGGAFGDAAGGERWW